MAIIRELKREDEKTVKELLKEVLIEDHNLFFDIDDFLNERNTRCIVAQEDEQVIGFGQVLWYKTASKKTVARIEDVVVNEAYRGKGIGKDISKKLMEIARSHDAGIIELTSKPERSGAGKLYESLGFKQRDTRVYRLKI